jgi:hypothetical protein
MHLKLPADFDQLTDIQRYHHLQQALHLAGYTMRGLSLGKDLPLHTNVSTGCCGNNWLPIVQKLP